MNLTVKNFDELTTTELYEILKARADVFIVEQEINYQDLDDIDFRATHFFYTEDGAGGRQERIAAYLRAFRLDDKSVKIGRVLTRERGAGIGRQILSEAMAHIKNGGVFKKICVDAQTHAIGFYEKLGFKVVSDEFLEEGIMHIKMETEI